MSIYLDKAKNKAISDLDGIGFDGNQYYVDKKLVKNIFNIKTDKKLKELLIVSGIDNPDFSISDNKFMAKDLTMIAGFAGGEKSKQLNDLANKLIQYKFSESKMQKDFDAERDHYDENIKNVFKDSSHKTKQNYSNQEQFKSTKHGYSFEIPKLCLLNYRGEYNFEKYCMDSARYNYYSAQNILSNASILSSAKELSNEASRIFYQEVGNLLMDSLTDKEKESIYNIPYDLIIKKTFDFLKDSLIKNICNNDRIRPENLSFRFTNQVLNNAFILGSLDVKVFKVVYKTFCIVQYNFITGKYNYNR